MKKVLVTGSAGFLGKKTVLKLLENNMEVIGIDLKKSNIIHPNYSEIISDIRTCEINNSFNTLIHLASVMNPPQKMSEGEIESIEIDGLTNLIRVFKKFGSDKFIFSSSGAAYGFTKRNLSPLKESDDVIGDKYFHYSRHKAEAEKILRSELQTNDLVILRPSTILGSGMKGPIYDYFKKKMIIGVHRYDSPFCFIHTDDVVSAIVQSVMKKNLYGTFNLAGDGALNLKDCCQILNTKYIRLPKMALKTGLHLLKKFNLTQYHPYQVDFMCYRPVLDNQKLKKNFDGLPSKSSEEVFLDFCQTEIFNIK